MSNTEERVVNMRFNNADFKKAAADTQKSLADVNKAVDDTGKTKGLLDLQAQMGGVSVQASAMSVAVATALGTLVNKITNVGLQMASSLTLDPVKQGFSEYEALLTKQNTIMNATGLSAQEVKGYLNELNTYSDKTIYSFSNMTDSIQKFVNAGVPLPQSVQSIEGIANAAAFAGATTEEANRAMYAFSQSMSAGFIMLQDWNQIENANMGTVQFKQTLIDSAVAAGTLTKKGNEYITAAGHAVTATKGWRDGLQDQWATTEVLNTALGKYSDTSTALGKKAAQSAKEVRTFTAFMDTLKESIGSGWSAVFTGLFGGLGQATKMWTGMSLAIGNVVNKFFNFAAGTLKVWRNLGGAEKTLQGFKNILSPFVALLGAVTTAWREAFPRSGRGAGEGLYGLSVAFEAVTRPLTLLAKLITGATPLLKVFFQVVGLGATVVGRIAGMIWDFVTALIGVQDLKAPASGGFLDFIKKIAAALGDAASKVDALLKKGASLKEAFGSVHLSLPNMPAMPDLGGFKLPSFGGDKAASGLDKVIGKTKELAGATRDVGSASQDAGSKGIFDFGSMMSGIGSFLVKMAGGIKDVISNFSWEDAVAAFNTAIFATMGIQLIKFIHTINKTFESFMGIGESFNKIMDSTTGALKSFQTQANAKLILNIGIALLLLAGALFIISKIPADKLVVSLGAVAALAVVMSKALKSVSQSVAAMDGKGVTVKMLAVSVAMIALAAAMTLLALAFILFNHVDVGGAVKALVAMYAMIKAVSVLGNMAEKSYKNLLAGAVAITAIAGSMLVLGAALLLFKLVDWESMLKAGLVLAAVSLAVGLLALVPAAALSKVGAAMLATSVGMVALALALIMFKLVEWESIGKLAVVLTELAVALAVIMAVGGPGGAATVLALAVSMVALAGSLLMLNNVEWASLGKMAVLFTILSVAMLAFTGILYLLAPVIPVMVLFGVALLAMGVGMLAFAGAMAIAISLGAAGVAAFAALATGAAVAVAVFLQTLAQEAPIMKKAFLEILQNLIDTIVEAVPMIIDGIKRLWAAIKAEFSGGATKAGSGKAGTDMVQSMGDKIKAKLPMIVQKAKELIVGFIKGLISKAPAIGAAATELIAGFIKGIASKIDKVVQAAVDLIIKFAQGIQKSYNRILQAGVDLIADFLHGLADTIRSSSGKIGGGITDVISAFKDVGVDMVKGIIAGVTSMIGDATSAIGSLASGMLDKAKSILKINSPSKEFIKIGASVGEGMAKGVAQSGSAAIVAVASLMQGSIATANEYLDRYLQDLDQRSRTLTGRANGLAAAAQRAATLAGKTKTKTDDKAAKALQNAADRADQKAQQAQNKYNAAADAQDRADEFEKASLSERALIRSQDAQNQLDASKAAKAKAEQDRAQAAALEKQAKAKGVTEKQRKSLQKEADKLRDDAKAQDQRAKDLIASAQGSAAEALRYQSLAGDELAALFQQRFEQEAQADADAAAFDKLSAADKAKKKREDAAKLEAASQQALAEAKKLAYTDVEAANQKAQDALEMANMARQYLKDAEGYDAEAGQTTDPVTGQTVALQPTEAAAIAFNNYADLYDAAVAAAAGTSGPTFIQNNTSPDALTPLEIYRQTNNLLTHAASNLQPAA